MLLLCALVVGLGNVWATDVVAYTFATAKSSGNTGYASTYDVTINKISWNVPGNQNFDGFVRIGGKNLSEENRIIKSNGTISDELTKITFNHNGINNSNFTVNSVKLTVASNSDFSSVIEEITKTPSFSVSTSGSFTFMPGEDDDKVTSWGTGRYYKFTINVSNSKSNNYGLDVTSIVFYKDGGGASTVETPTFDPVSGTYTSAQSVGINCETGSATIHYTMTTDGTEPDDPTESDAVYSSKISVTVSGTQIKAKAFKAEMTASSVASATYTIKPNKPTVSAVGATVTISGDDGLTFYYTTDGSAPDNKSTEYTAPFVLAEDCTIKARAYDTYGNASDVSTAYKFKYMPLSPKNIGSGYYEKVTDVGDLENGDAILIVNETEKVALSTTQNTNNRGQQTVTITTGTPNVIYAPSASAQKLVLVKKTEKISEVDTDVFYFYTGASGYLYAASSSSNVLKTETTPDDNNNARATISFSSGDATILFTGSNSRKWLKYNSSSSLFSCYATSDATQSIVQIYKEVAHNVSVTLNSSGYATYASTFALDFSDDSEFSAWQIKGISGSTITFEQIDGAVAAGTGVLLKGTASASINIPVVASGSSLSATNKLTGITAATAVTADQYYGLSGNTFKKVNAGTVPAGKALLPASEVSAGVKAFKFVFEGEDDADGINAVNGEGFKVNGPIYNLAGQRINKLQKGINIVNGKKVLY